MARPSITQMIKSLFNLSKRHQFIIAVFILSCGVFASEFARGPYLLLSSLLLGFLASFFFWFSVRRDIQGNFFYPILILPFLYTLSFSLFFPLIPARLLTRAITTLVYAFGLYSLFLTQNIFAVSTIRTINLVRSARIVSFVLTIVVVFLISNVIFSQRFPIYISSVLVLIVTFLLNLQSLWTYYLNKESMGEAMVLSGLISFCMLELSLILSIWPINAAIYSIFITGIFYAYSGLSHAWVEKRLFRNVLWEYIWVGFLAVLILIFFSRWGI